MRFFAGGQSGSAGTAEPKGKAKGKVQQQAAKQTPQEQKDAARDLTLPSFFLKVSTMEIPRQSDQAGDQRRQFDCLGLAF